MRATPPHVFVAALALATTPAASGAAAPFDPAATNVDRICDAYAAAANARDIVELARVDRHDDSVPAWRRSDTSENARLRAVLRGEGGDFATVTFDRGGIVLAETVGIDAESGDEKTRAWCFIGGRLSRATLDLVAGGAGSGWRRTAYYGDDLAKPVSEYFTQIPAGRSGDARARPSQEALAIDPWPTPAKLPFAEPANAAHAMQLRRT